MTLNTDQSSSLSSIQNLAVYIVLGLVLVVFIIVLFVMVVFVIA